MKVGRNERNKIIRNIILVAIVVYFLVLLITQQSILDRNIGEYEKVLKKTEQIELENEKLKAELEDADTDEYLEKLIRERLGYVKSDETVFVER
ncbi:MAG: septum formation initiator family protein [Clostridia bacterium]|nr:septum formation initiator family protein [Clostridia bacterium]